MIQGGAKPPFLLEKLSINRIGIIKTIITHRMILYIRGCRVIAKFTLFTWWWRRLITSYAVTVFFVVLSPAFFTRNHTHF
ncbi:hypothetical protein AN700_0210940 [Klebsiella michiganensis]|nr:hypothetical protein C2U43_20730 [Citrobacter freundii complex sp. CFNIH9]OEG94604.1 hypothetical protein AN700_0210940 [Klebsiella michiganensis]